MMNFTKPNLILLLAIFFSTIQLSGQEDADSTGLPGDHFSLHGALDLFKNANSVEAFEKLLNTKDNSVNNLDLDEDGDVDYVKVIDKVEKEAHAFILQVAISENENQDIAVIELEKTGKESAIIQIIGDEDIYGEAVIVEASDGDDNEEDKKGRGPNTVNFDYFDYVVVNVWAWPTVRFVYAPAYTPWVSPWRWRLYPVWYRPWRPLAWHVYHPMRLHYHIGYRSVTTHRVTVAHRVYTPHRVSSVTVKTRHASRVNNYRVTKTTRTTTVQGARGNEFKVKQSTTKVKGSNGNVKAKKTKTTVTKKRK